MSGDKHFLCSCLLSCAEGQVNIMQGYKHPVFVNQVELMKQVLAHFPSQKFTNPGLAVLNILEVTKEEYNEFLRVPKIIQLPKFES